MSWYVNNASNCLIAKPLQIPRGYKSVTHCAQVSWFLHIVVVTMAMAIVVAIP